MRKFPTFDEVHAQACGQWDKILLSVIGKNIEPALLARPNHAPCPVHAGKDSFHLFRDFNETGGGFSNKENRGFADGFSLIAWACGITDLQALNLVALHLNMVDNNNHMLNKVTVRKPLPQPATQTQPVPKKAENIRLIWDNRKKFTRTESYVGWLYLKSRGINPWPFPSNLFFHQGMNYYQPSTHPDGKIDNLGKFPCLIAGVTDLNGRLVTIHRTYLKKDGSAKAPVPSPKKMMPPALPGDTKGCAVQLYKATGRSLGLAEGIETALAVAEVSQMPVWATLHTAGMETVQIPKHVTDVFIWADKDRPTQAHPEGAGYEAAKKLRNHLTKQGVTVHILLPLFKIPKNKKGIDWLDVKNAVGKSGFPVVNRKFNRPSVA
jgi:hypothetical protein